MVRSNNPMVTVIIPAYNAADYIDEALHSVLAQEYQPLEILVVDDGSSDTTAEKAAQYGDKIRYIHQANAGPGAARNKGLENARGDLIAFLDSDDTWLPGKLARQTALMNADPEIGLSFHDFYFEQELGQPPILAFSLAPQLSTHPRRELAPQSYLFTQPMFEPLLLRNYIGTSTVMIRRSCLERVGQFDATLPSAQDREFWLRIARQYPLGFIDEPLTRYRFNPNSITRNSEKRAVNIIRLLERHRVYAGPETRRKVEEELAGIRQDLAYLYFEGNRMREARRAYLQAFKHSRNWANLAYLAAAGLPQPLITLVRTLKGWKKS